MVTTASLTQTIQEGNQKELRLLVTSSPISNDNETSRFAPKSLLDAAIKLLPAPFPIKNMPTLITIGKWNFRKIPSNWEFLRKNHPFFEESFDEFQEKNLWEKTWPIQEEAFQVKFVHQVFEHNY